MKIKIILSVIVGSYLNLGSTAIAAPKTPTQVKKFLRTQAKAGKLLQKLPLASKAVNTKKKAARIPPLATTGLKKSGASTGVPGIEHRFKITTQTAARPLKESKIIIREGAAG